MIYVDLPSGDRFGWGICGDNLARALLALVPIERLFEEPPLPLPGPLLQSVGPNLRPSHEWLSAVRRVGYVMFEHDLMARRVALRALSSFDAIATACRWGENALRDGGLHTVTTIPQGIDHTRFNPERIVRQGSTDRFIIFSGGKFEFRKGQDIVAKVFKIFADRHTDAFLVAAWYNRWWRLSMGTMKASPYWPFVSVPGESPRDAIYHWLATTGIDLERVQVVPPLPNSERAVLYGNSDVGLFPNRCEGATNLVLMEYMACGRAGICTDFGGHRDLLTDANSFPLRASELLRICDEEHRPIAHWCEPNLDEILDRLEQAYADRARLKELGRQAAADMKEWTWSRAAGSFLQLLIP
jgi:glycosyltransferase involved in cell wall biosynthesis